MKSFRQRRIILMVASAAVLVTAGVTARSQPPNITPERLRPIVGR
jgi:hypothetical protein